MIGNSAGTASKRSAFFAVICALLIVAVYHAAVRFIPEALCSFVGKEYRSAVSAAVRLICAGALVGIWYKTSLSALAPHGGERFFRPVKYKYIAVAALCGTLMQTVFASAVTLAISAYSSGARFDPTDVTEWAAALTAVAVAPLCEELVFRGAALRLTRASSPLIISALVTSVLFGMTHGDAISAAVACYIGFLLAYITERKGSLLPALAFHASFNLTSFFIGYIPFPPVISLGLSLPPALLCMIALLKGNKNEAL